VKDFTIMTDSCCDMPRKYIDEKAIPFVSLTCNLNGKEYYDDFGKSLSYQEFYDSMRSGVIPKTSQPSPDAFYKVFKEIVSSGKDILYVCVSSGLSGTYNSANIAKNMILDEFEDARIEIVDTLTASLGQGLMLMRAIEMKERGSSLDEIVNHLEGIKFNLNTYMTVDDLNHLKRGGRISAAAAIVGVVLHIKPLLTLSDEGKVHAILKVKGRKSVINKLAEFVCKKIEHPEDEIVAICHGDAEAEALKLKEIIMSQKSVKDVLINYVGPVVGTYGGPGAMAVFFVGKHRQNHLIDLPL
jgi:DegV family protein with EDD domain